MLQQQKTGYNSRVKHDKLVFLWIWRREVWNQNVSWAVLPLKVPLRCAGSGNLSVCGYVTTVFASISTYLLFSVSMCVFCSLLQRYSHWIKGLLSLVKMWSWSLIYLPRSLFQTRIDSEIPNGFSVTDILQSALHPKKWLVLPLQKDNIIPMEAAWSVRSLTLMESWVSLATGSSLLVNALLMTAPPHWWASFGLPINTQW